MEALATYGWGKDTSVEEWLYGEGHRFDFYQAVHLLEALFPDRDRVGEGVDPARQPVRFSSRVDFGFPGADVDSITPPTAAAGAAAMKVAFMGLAGGLGPLPRTFSEQVVERSAKKDTAFRDFLDIFNHRLVSMFYRARKKVRPALEGGPPSDGRTARPFFALIGLGTAHLEGRMDVHERALLPYSGILSRKARTMVGLERLLEDHFGAPVTLAPFCGRWYPLAEDQVTHLGASGRNRALGRGAVLGSRVWNQESTFELELGPIGLEQHLDFLPTGDAFRPLGALVEFYVGSDLEYSLRLKLRADEVPGLRLGSAGGARLGWTTWLKSRDFFADDSQVVLHRSSGVELERPRGGNGGPPEPTR